KSKTEEWLNRKTSTLRVFEEIMEAGGLYKLKIEKKEKPMVKAGLRTKVLEGGVEMEEPFKSKIEKNGPIAYEIKRIIKRQTEMMIAFNSLAEMMPVIERLGKDGEEEIDVDEVYKDLARLWKIAIIEQSMALRNTAEDMKELQYRACGIRVPREDPEITVLEEGEKEKVEEKIKERRIIRRRDFTKRDGESDRGSEAGRGRGRRNFTKERERGRGRGRGSSRY
ncbi:MAG: hypothetical protein ACK52I_31205, partial [Pseudomonadota bacterium]